MRFPKKKKVESGDIRVRKVFAFLPIQTKENTYWLETVTVEERVGWEQRWYAEFYSDGYTLIWKKTAANGEPIEQKERYW